jgi:hypothetical protein
MCILSPYLHLLSVEWVLAMINATIRLLVWWISSVLKMRRMTFYYCEFQSYRYLYFVWTACSCYVCWHFYRGIKSIDANEFGFTTGHSIGLCTSYLKRTVEYTSRDSHVFAACIDFSEAFDQLTYWKLIKIVIDVGVYNRFREVAGSLVKQPASQCLLA